MHESTKYSESQITICTVSYYNEEHLKLNTKLTKSLNVSEKHKWIIVENTPKSRSSFYAKEQENITIIEGSQKNSYHTPNEHHAAGLMKALDFVDTRFVLISDPDFFILRPNWINSITTYMDNNDLSFFGVPWHPKWYIKYRYFPCVHCLIIDLEKVHKDELNFMPDFSEVNPFETDGKGKLNSFAAKFKKKIPPQIKLYVKMFKNLTVERRKIGWDGDTGAKFYIRFSQDNNIQHECVTPVYNPIDELQIQVPYKLNRLVENVLPDRLRYIPNKNGYYTKSGLFDNNLKAYQWEEFLWQNKLFGFHVRGYPKRDKRNLRLEIDHIDNTIKYFTK